MAEPGAGIVSGMQSLPVRQMLRDLALGIAEAQQQLDGASLRALREAAALEIDLGDAGKSSALEMGLIPTFYQFREATIDLSFSMSMHTEESMSIGAQIDVTASKETSSEY